MLLLTTLVSDQGREVKCHESKGDLNGTIYCFEQFYIDSNCIRSNKSNKIHSDIGSTGIQDALYLQRNAR